LNPGNFRSYSDQSLRLGAIPEIGGTTNAGRGPPELASLAATVLSEARFALA
jgi:hypothetical protein